MNTPPFPTAPDAPDAQDVLHFWLGDGLQRGWCSDNRDALWFGGGPELDESIRQRFGPLVDSAMDGGLQDWEAQTPTRLALVLLLDQFSRNIYRGQARAFAGDQRAQQLVRQTLASGLDDQMATVGRVFLYMPLVHAEDLASQDESVARFQHLLDRSPPELNETLARNLHFAKLHRDIVLRFGRFPHRNAALGRTSTAEELAFLKDGPRFGQ
ncbi:DUF924 family protein [Rhodoferax sp.]|uniref:DUF924 family protein n=1 Tax=Rhodoferax sp. TaxID=50421 RepID=UPI002736DC50|nr:DUF924 family protein [Rhodoferax sp.]MDP3190281.1 DUF924 family protein [Rhodoferax sp.]